MKTLIYLILIVTVIGCTNPLDLDNGVDYSNSKNDKDSELVDYVGFCNFSGYVQQTILDNDNLTVIDEIIDNQGGHARMIGSVDGKPKPIENISINDFEFSVNSNNGYWITRPNRTGDLYYYSKLNSFKIDGNEHLGSIDTTMKLFERSLSIRNISFMDTLSKSNDITVRWNKGGNPSNQVHLQLTINNKYDNKDAFENPEKYGVGSIPSENSGEYTWKAKKLKNLTKGYYHLKITEIDSFMLLDDKGQNFKLTFEATRIITIYITD